MASRRFHAGLLCLLALFGGAATANDKERVRKAEAKTPSSAETLSTETLACYRRLGRIAQFTVSPALSEPPECVVEDLVRLERIIMDDGTHVMLSPAPRVRCTMAEAIAEWSREEIGPLAVSLGGRLVSVSTLASYECRSRNRILGLKVSEHAKGNAVDINAIKLSNGATYSLIDPGVSKPFREGLRVSACQRFTTVLGPGSDPYHSGHVHLDLAERSRGYRICQWELGDRPLVGSEVPLPPRRPPGR